MNVVRQPSAPFYDGGYRLPRVDARIYQTVRQPSFPLYEHGAFIHGMGASGPGVLAVTAPIAAKAGGVIAAAVGAGSWAGPIGAGIGILVGVIAGLWAAHAARVAGATHENQAINSAVQTWDQGMQAIFAAANSSDPSQNVTGAQAATQVQQLFGQFWAQMSQYMHSPGTADTSNMGTNCGSTQLNPAGPCAGTPGGHMCDKSCTASCCVGCQDLYPAVLQAVQVLNSATGGTVQVCAVVGSSYGANARSAYTLTYTPPAISAGVGAPISSLTQSLSSLFGATGAADSGTSLVPVLAIGALAFFLLR